MSDHEETAKTAETVARLEEEVDHLKKAVDSHATVDQAIGIVVALGQVTPEQGWDVLQEVSQHTNIKLRTIADLIVTWGQNGELPAEVQAELGASLARRSEGPPSAGSPA
ncbi:ANTAR domain-containing protein [Streptomyces formicae]